MTQTLSVFGDSVGRGVVFDAIQNKYQFLKDSFARLISENTDIGVRNYSSFGCTVTKGMRAVEKRINVSEPPGAVLLEFGGNDCDYLWAEVSENPDGEHLPKTTMDVFTETYTNMIETIRSAGGEPVLMTLPPIDSERYFKRISENLSQQNILHWLGSVDRIYRWHEYYSLAVCRIAYSTGVPLVDVRSAFLTQKNTDHLICDDGIHPTAEGHALISQVITEALLAS